MATIYFTNNANSGTGSLRQALAGAANGDVVTPDPTVFAPGESIAIILTSQLVVQKSLTIDAGATRIWLERTTTATAVTATNGEYLRLVGIDCVGGVTTRVPETTLSRCRLYGNAAETRGINAPSDDETAITLNDCLVTGFLGIGVYCYLGGSIALVRSTVAGNVRDVHMSASVEYSEVDSIVAPNCSTSGFVAPPPDTLDTSAPLPWENWDFRLLPSSPYASGATAATGEYDVEGNARGRTVGAATSYAVGAYELVVADYYQASGSSASFNAPEDWTVDPQRATRPSAIAAGVFYLDENATWTDAPPEGSSLVIAGRRAETFASNLALEKLEVGRDSALVFSGRDRVVSAKDARIGAGARMTAPAGSSGYLAVPSRLDVSGGTYVGVVVAGLGAKLTSFSATSERSGRATLRWTAEDGTETIRLERRVGSGEWLEVAAEVAAATGSFTTSLERGRAAFRAFDGERFWSDDAWGPSGVQFRVVASVVPGERVAQLWRATTMVVSTSESVKVGQGVTILAQISDAFDANVLFLADGSNVQSVSYTCYYVSNGLFEETLTPITGHEEIDAGIDCVLEAPQRSDAWTRDEVGYTFALTPDVRTSPLFEKPGEYRIKIVVRPTVGNPATFYVPITVVES